MPEMNKIERKYLVHLIDANFNKGETNYIKLGEDLEEYSIELNPDSDTKKNILGETKTVNKGYEPNGSVETYYAYESEPLFEQLAKIANERLTGSECKTTVIDILINADGTVAWAYREDAIVIPKSIGGDTGGVQIPFEIHYNGNRVKGNYDLETKKFTQAAQVALNKE